jgi:hypothetical protein
VQLAATFTSATRIGDHGPDRPDDGLHVHSADVPVLLHRGGDHVVHLRIGDIAIRVHPVDRRQELPRALGRPGLARRDNARRLLDLAHQPLRHAGRERHHGDVSIIGRTHDPHPLFAFSFALVVTLAASRSLARRFGPGPRM